MMTSSYGNIFRVTGPLWGESTGHRWIFLTKAGDAELWYFLWSAPEQTFEQSIETLVTWDTIALIMTSLMNDYDIPVRGGGQRCGNITNLIVVQQMFCLPANEYSVGTLLFMQLNHLMAGLPHKWPAMWKYCLWDNITMPCQSMPLQCGLVENIMVQLAEGTIMGLIKW